MLFESAIEKLGRILAGQYGIEVIFEGNQAMTDGKKIVLPYVAKMTEEMQADLNGYLDHEVAHCRFSSFDEMARSKNKMHHHMLNAVEDIRIEREMINLYPGTEYHLKPLRAKVDGHHAEHWDKLTPPTRIILNIVKIMRDLEPRIDKDIERYIDLVRDASKKLNECTSTEEVRRATEEIMRLIQDEREKEKDEEPEDEESDPEDDSENEDTDSEDTDKDSKRKGSKPKDKKPKKPKDGSKADEEDDRSDGDEGGEDEDSSGSPDGGVSDESEGEGEDGDSGRKERADAGDSDALKDLDRALEGSSVPFEGLKDTSEIVNDGLKIAIEDEAEDLEEIMHRPPLDPIWEGMRSIPVTTRFDKVTEHSGKGESSRYGRLKREVMPLISPIKMQLERILKVRENAKWTSDKEQGKIDSRALSRLASMPGTRRVFKEFTKVETNNVAVEILIDMSGSMRDRMLTAKQATIAMAEALKDINVPFEVTGFNSVPNHEVMRYAASIGDTSRFNRIGEALDLHVFKDFDSISLSGLEKIFVGMQNPDGECVVWAAKRLLKRREKRKILIVLSDGEPCTGDHSNRGILCSDLKNNIKLIQRSGVECVGIGIETNCVKHFYPDYLVLNNVKELPLSAMRKLAKIVGG